MSGDKLASEITTDMIRISDRQHMCDTALRQCVEALFVALNEHLLSIDMPHSAFVRNLRMALDDARDAHGET
jgi:hypothetical protein